MAERRFTDPEAGPRPEAMPAPQGDGQARAAGGRGTPDLLEKREWRLWCLAILTILWLTLGILVTPLARRFGLGHLALVSDTGTSVFYLGLVVLVFALCLYFVLSFKEVGRLRSRMLESRQELHGMAVALEGLRSLVKVTASITSQVEISSLLKMIVREAVRVLGAQHSSLMLLDRSRTVLRTVATHGVDIPAVRAAKVRLGEGVAGWVAERGKPRLLQGQLEGGEFRECESKERAISSAACVPLQIQDRILGVLNVNLLEGGRQFEDHELRLLMIYANHAAVAIRNAALLKESQEKAKLRAILEGYVSPVVANALMRNPKGWMNVGGVRELTVLFADIRGFTKVVHQLGPQQTRLFLNHFFTQMTEILFQHDGTLDKFIGDSVMAFFGAPLKVDVPAIQAVKAARAMQLAFAQIRTQWTQKNPAVERLSLGVGMATGRLFVGNVGSRKRFDYTVIGQEVNVAKRLCDMAQGGQILLCEATRGMLPGGVPVRDLGEKTFKGLERCVHHYQLVDPVAESGPLA